MSEHKSFHIDIPIYGSQGQVVSRKQKSFASGMEMAEYYYKTKGLKNKKRRKQQDSPKK